MMPKTLVLVLALAAAALTLAHGAELTIKGEAGEHRKLHLSDQVLLEDAVEAAMEKEAGLGKGRGRSCCCSENGQWAPLRLLHVSGTCYIPQDCYPLTTTSNSDRCANYCFARGYVAAIWSNDGACYCCCPP